MSEELRPLAEYTTEDLTQELRKRVTVGVFVLMVGDPSAAETLRDHGKTQSGTPTTDGLWIASDGVDREELEELYRCLKVALGYRIKFFHEQFGAVPRCFEVTP